MDGTRFDDVARRFGRMLDRRRVLAAVAAIGAAGVAGVDAVGAAPRRTCRPVAASCLRGRECCSGICETRRTAPRNRRNRCVCPAGEIACGMECVDPSSNKNHCGACGNVCPGTCVSGVCTCQGVTCTVDEAGGWEKCGIDNETCAVLDSCTLRSVNANLDTSCETHTDCAGFDDSCDADGNVCRCINGSELAGTYIEFDQPVCAVIVPQVMPGLCELTCVPGSGYDSCVLTTSGATISVCNAFPSPNNSSVNFQGQQPSQQTIGCSTDADCQDQCLQDADACYCTLGGVEGVPPFFLWSDSFGVDKACVAVAIVGC